MYRSASWNRMADDYFLHSWQNGATEMRMSMSYQLMIQPWKWQRRKNVINVEVGIKTDSVAERIEGLEIEGDVHTDSDGTQTGFLPIDTVDLDVSRTRRTTDHKIFRKLAKRN
uniref:Uncharacterized protein n=1 Tax=Manihot esculenta TaxID=3983 RepID=A0A2C9VRV7_MANES